METAISKIYEVDDLGTTPARVNRETGELYINKRVWPTLSKNKRMFILLHEAGHASLKTRNEFEADEYAFNNYAAMGLPLSESIKALSRVLPFDKPQHEQRVMAQFNRAFQYDNSRNKPIVNPAQELYAKSLGFDSFLGIKLKSKARRAAEARIKELSSRVNEEKAIAANKDYELDKTKDNLVVEAKAQAQDKTMYFIAGIIAIGAIIFYMMKRK